MVLRRTKQSQISFGYCDTRTGQRVYPPPAVDKLDDLLPAQRPPVQDEARIASDDMGVQLSCWPPLGQTTIIESGQESVVFTVLVEGPEEDEPEVSLWHNHADEGDWKELCLKPVQDLKGSAAYGALLLSGDPEETLRRHWYHASLKGVKDHSVSFTLKYRPSPQAEWQWIKDTTGMPDGQLHYQADIELSNTSDIGLDHYFSELSSDIKAERAESEVSHTTLYSLTSSVKAACGEDSGYQHHRLGKPRKCSKWFALVRLWSPWLAPRHGGGGKFELDKDGVLLSFQRTDGLHVVCLGISGVEDTMSTFINEDDGVVIKVRNDREQSGTSRVLVAVGKTFDLANCAVMYHARKVIAGHSAASEPQRAAITKEIATLAAEKVKPEWMEEWWDGFTYCTWNGLGQDLTAQKIYDALDDLASNGIRITNLIIDDNWQSLGPGETQFKRGWTSFEANAAGFPDGLKATTAEIRKRHPTVNHIAVWHALLGYWGGIDPNGEIAKNYHTVQVEKEPSGVAGGTFTIVAAPDAQRLYDDFYRFLAASGIDAVKTDAQFFLDLLRHAPDRRHFITEYQDAWTLAHLRHLSARAISCMSQFPQALFHAQLPTNKPLLLLRNSDDFFPAVEASHPWHVFCNAHNALLTQHLNALPDWDMFQTSHPWAHFHAAARCVSGGPIYFTDKPGEHDIGLIRAMTGVTTRGKTVILRPHRVGKAVEGCVYNPYAARAVLKVGTYVGFARTGAGILGCFNVSSAPVRELITLADFPGTEEEGEYVVGTYRSRRLSAPIRSRSTTVNTETKGAAAATIAAHLALDPGGWDVLTAYAVRSIPFPSSTNPHNSPPTRLAPLGLHNKLTGAAALTGFTATIESPSPNNNHARLRIWVQLKALGVLGVWIEGLRYKSVEEDLMVVIWGVVVPEGCVTIGAGGEDGRDGDGGDGEEADARKDVLSVDVERAWKEGGFESGWGNEVSLEIFVR